MMNNELGRPVPLQWALAPAIHHSSFIVHHLILSVLDRPKTLESLASATRTTTSRDLGLRAVTLKLPALASTLVASGVQVAPPSREMLMSTRLMLLVIDHLTLYFWFLRQ